MSMMHLIRASLVAAPLLLLLAACTLQVGGEPANASAAASVEPAATPAPAKPPVASNAASTALAVGAPAPDFTAQAWQAGDPLEFKLADARAKGPVVVYFFPAAYTPGCNIEAHLFSQAIERFAAQGASVIGVTAGNADQLAKFSADNERCAGKFPVAADPGARIAAKYGVVLDKKPEWSNRTSFVITRDGRIAAVHSEMSPEGHVDAMLAGLKAL